MPYLLRLSCLLAALLLGLPARPAAAQEFLGGLTLTSLGLARDTQYARLRVRAVLVRHRDVAHPGRPEPGMYTEYDAQGRVVRAYLAKTNPYGRQVLGDRLDLTYAPDGQLATATLATRTNPRADTSLLGEAWLPGSRDQLALPPDGTGVEQLWDARTSSWRTQLRQQARLRHDTTYLTRLSNVGSVALERRYLAGPYLHRTDRLTYDNYGRLREALYLYEQYDPQGHSLEQGQLGFRAEAARAGLDTLRLPKAAYDSLARRSRQGRRQPLLRSTYNARGQLVSTGYAGYSPAQLSYDAAGRLLTQQQYYQGKPGATTSFRYLPSGLRASYRIEHPDRHQLDEYEYRYFFR